MTPTTHHSVKLQQTLYTSTNPTRRWLHQNRRDWIKNAIDRYCEKKNHLAVDLGAGIGVYLKDLDEKHEHVLGLDNNPEMVKWGRKTFTEPNITYLSGDARTLPLRDNCADLIICSEVLEHIKESPLCLKEIHRVLRPGGRLLLSMPQPYSLLEIVARIALGPLFLPLTQKIYHEAVYPTGHINLISAKKTRQLLTNQGFIVNESSQSGLYLPFFAELVPNSAKAVAKKIDSKIRKSKLSSMLWTQFHVATKIDQSYR